MLGQYLDCALTDSLHDLFLDSPWTLIGQLLDKHWILRPISVQPTNDKEYPKFFAAAIHAPTKPTFAFFMRLSSVRSYIRTCRLFGKQGMIISGFTLIPFTRKRNLLPLGPANFEYERNRNTAVSHGNCRG